MRRWLTSRALTGLLDKKGVSAVAESNVRFSRRKAFATLYREVAQDTRLSLESRGLLLLMASLPEDWEYSVAGLAKKAGCGKDKLRRILGELENVGYLAREQCHDAEGKFAGNMYVIQDDAPPLSGKPDNGETRQRFFPLSGNPTEHNKECTVEENKEPPKAPQGGKRSHTTAGPQPGKYDLQEDAKFVLRAYVGGDHELAQALATLIEVRVAKKAINSKRAILSLLRTLERLSEGRREDKLLLLEQSVINSWKGVFPLKGRPPAQTSGEAGGKAWVSREKVATW